MMLTVVFYFLCGKGDARLKFDSGHYLFSPLLIRNAYDTGVRHFLMLVNHRFDLLRGDIFSSGDDDMLQSVCNVVISILILFAQITCPKPSIHKYGLCLS